MTASARRGLAVAALALVGLVLVVVLARGGSDGHDVFVTVPKATGVVKGQYVRAAGGRVGRVADITPVRRGRAARIKLHLDDEAWPVTKGSRFVLRWGGTINQYNRYIAYERAADGPAIAQDGGELPSSVMTVPVEYGELLSVFGTDERRDLKTFLNRSGLALDKAGPQLDRALRVAPPAVEQADDVLSTLDDNRAELETLVRSTARVVSAVNRADPGLGRLVVGAGTTLNATAQEAQGLRGTLEQAPGTFRRATATLRRADRTLVPARDVIRRIGPGVTELRRIATPLNRLMASLEQIGPDAQATLRTAATGAPDVTKLLQRLTTTAPQLTSIAGQADVAVNCIRPYTPEIVSLGSLWGSALSSTDGRDRYIRAQPEVFLPAPHNAQYQSSAELIKNNPGVTYAFPRPPGTQAGQTWFLPECGAGPEALDPTKDPEARNFNPISKFITPQTQRFEKRAAENREKGDR